MYLKNVYWDICLTIFYYKSTLKRISNYDFANIPIEKVKRESIEDFLEDERPPLTWNQRTLTI